MSIAVYKLLNRNVTRALKSTTHNFVRMLASTDEPCPGKQAEPSKPKEPCPPKADPTPPPSPSCQKPPSSTCPKPPPCPSMPQCPPTICPPFVDSSNPCNYCPPPCPDPEARDMTRIKKWQCFFQEENDIPLYVKRGNFDAFVVQTVYVIVALSFFYFVFLTFNFVRK